VTALEAITPVRLGFQPIAVGPEDNREIVAWQKEVKGEPVIFRLLHSLGELAIVEELQREVLGASELDVMASSTMVIIPETGGAIIGAIVDREGESIVAGASVGWGGFRHGQPHFLSDFLVIRRPFRSLGLGYELKRLQAGLALERGFSDITWTVDPLRALNAYFNFSKLGAFAECYERDRYGSSYGVGFYGGLPTDRLHVTWPISDAVIIDRLLFQLPEPSDSESASLPFFTGQRSDPDAVLIAIPSDIDHVVQTDPASALQWRVNVRHQIESAFASGYIVTGFVRHPKERPDASALVLTQQPG
jgi:chorismate synthase